MGSHLGSLLGSQLISGVRIPFLSVFFSSTKPFESRLALLLIKKDISNRICPFLINEAHTGLEGSRSRLPARSVLLLRRGVHRTPAPRLALFYTK